MSPKSALPQLPSEVTEPSEYLAPISHGAYEFMNHNDLGKTRVVPPSEIRRTSSEIIVAESTLTRIAKIHNKHSHSFSTWFSNSLLRYEEAVHLPDNSRVIIQRANEFL